MADKKKGKEKKGKGKIVVPVELPPKQEFCLRTLSTTYILDERTKEFIPMSKASALGITPEEQLTQPSKISRDKSKPEEIEVEGSRIETEGFKEPVFLEVDEEKANLKAVTIRMKNIVTLVSLKPEMWTDEHDSIIITFLTTQKQVFLLIYLTSNAELLVTFEAPTAPINEIFYFIKKPNAQLITLDTFSNVMYFGLMKANMIVSLLRQMHQIFVPIVVRNKTWPETIKNDFIGQLYRFVASLTDIRYKLKGKTVFYVPPHLDLYLPHEAAKDKDLVRRIEGCLVYWIKQMKELMGLESLDVGEKAGPLTEIDFWQCRCEDLMGVVSQLNKPNVKHFVLIMELANLSSFHSFQKLSQEIEQKSAEAQSNHQFLLLLQDQCQVLSSSAPSAIPSLLPLLINTIRFIWVNSAYYNSREKITGLFRKISNQILQQCYGAISEDRLFEGHSHECINTIKECIDCCTEWKRIYQELFTVHQRYSNADWHLDTTSIFAQINAFIQRCHDLLNICDCQIHFGRREYGERIPLPACFSGQNKHLLIESMLEVEALFSKAIQIIIDIKPDMLDVQSAVWQNRYLKFCNAIKELDNIIQNTINLAFEYIHNLGDAVLIIDSFNHFSHRKTIKRTIDKKIVQIYTMLNDELHAVRKDFSKKCWETHSSFPYYSGHAYYAYSLRDHLNTLTQDVLDAWWLPRIPLGDKAIAEYEKLIGELNAYALKVNQEWLSDLDDDPRKRLETPLMFRSHDRFGLIESNFDRTILKLWQEVLFWKPLNFQLHHKADELFQTRSAIKAVAEIVVQVSREYNTTRVRLTREEQLLFTKRIAIVDKKIHPGLIRVTWKNVDLCESYIHECRPVIGKLQNMIRSYKLGQEKIGLSFQKISDLKLLNIDIKKVYEEEEFIEEQAAYRDEMKKVVQNYNQTIITVAMSTYQIFLNDGKEVQQEWTKYAERIDSLFEEALRLSVRRTLQLFLKAITGEESDLPLNLFKVKIVLSGSEITTQPSMEVLANIISSVMKNTCSVLEGIGHLAPTISPLVKSSSQDFDKILMKDKESLELKNSLNSVVTAVTFKLQKYLNDWESYKDIWQVDKNEFIQQYQNKQPTVAMFDTDIARYTEIANDVQTHNSFVNFEFCVLDFLPLKFAILDHCSEWQNKLTSLLKDLSLKQLHSIYGYVDECMNNLMFTPENLDQLRQKMELCNSVMKDKDEKQKEFELLRDQFKILAKYETAVSEEDMKLLKNLESRWIKFLNSLLSVDDVLKN